MKPKILSLYDIFLIAGVIISNIVYSILEGSVDIVGSIAGIAGVVCVVLVAKGSIWNYLFGVINVSLYAWISYKAQLYGDAGLNALYYFPMQFIGWWQWRKRGAATSSNTDDGRVKARRLTLTQRLLLGGGCVVAVVAVGFLLKHFNDPQPFKDSLTTVLSIVAQALMSLAFMEQWVLWITTNVVSVVMWTILAVRGEQHAALMVIMWCFYLMNSINGLRVWIGLSKNASGKAAES
ncbi:MAG: nicotinamide riboside transporter PnuC [Candidatus Cryptobacteroides sp.]